MSHADQHAEALAVMDQARTEHDTATKAAEDAAATMADLEQRAQDGDDTISWGQAQRAQNTVHTLTGQLAAARENLAQAERRERDARGRAIAEAAVAELGTGEGTVGGRVRAATIRYRDTVTEASRLATEAHSRTPVGQRADPNTDAVQKSLNESGRAWSRGQASRELGRLSEAVDTATAARREFLEAGRQYQDRYADYLAQLRQAGAAQFIADDDQAIVDPDGGRAAAAAIDRFDAFRQGTLTAAIGILSHCLVKAAPQPKSDESEQQRRRRARAERARRQREEAAAANPLHVPGDEAPEPRRPQPAGLIPVDAA